MHSGTFRARQIFVFLFFLLSLAILIIRLFDLQGIKYSFYYKIANEEHIVSVELQPKRGTIFDRNMRVLAVNLNRISVYFSLTWASGLPPRKSNNLNIPALSSRPEIFSDPLGP